MQRDYASIPTPDLAVGDRTQRMRAVIDALWPMLSNAGVSWIGFYLHAENDELILGPREPKPACSPIGMHGACGQAFTSRQPLIVHDVRDLGENYVACDPRDQSEVVIPCVNPDGSCWGVLDLDSFDVGSFSQADVHGLATILRAANLTH